MVARLALVRVAVYNPRRRFDGVLLNPQPLPPRYFVR
jgi:hypothetical protein